MTLHDELHDLTGNQPTQPADRLSVVTRKARTMRRNRTLASVAAVVAFATPVGIALAANGGGAAPIDYAASPATWSDRSQSGEQGLADSALDRWASEGNPAVASPKWLYRGRVQVPGGTPQYVVAFVADSKVVMGFGSIKDKDDNGLPKKPAVDGWQLKGIAVDDAPPVLSLYLLRLDTENLDDNWLFALAAPRSRELSWRTTPLPFAPVGGTIADHGSFRSSNGVFQGWTGAVSGRLTGTVGSVTTPLSFPDAAPQLTPVVDGPQLGTAFGISAGAGQLDEDSSSIGYSNESDSANGTARVRIRCYGGGRITVVDADERAVGSAACDNQEHSVALPAQSNGQRLVRLLGDTLQVYAFAIDRT